LLLSVLVVSVPGQVDMFVSPKELERKWPLNATTSIPLPIEDSPMSVGRVRELCFR
jgi:hypothetical protein